MYRPRRAPAALLLFAAFSSFLFWSRPLPREFCYAVPRDHNCDKREKARSDIDLGVSKSHFFFNHQHLGSVTYRKSHAITREIWKKLVN